jgi:hypothetical protein
MQPYGYLSQYSNAVTPPLLDLFRQNETGHLSITDRSDPIKSRSSKDAYGSYQLRGKHLHNLGYKLPPYTVKDALDPIKSRDIAGKFIKGYSDHYGFKNVADTLIGYNMGAKATSDWIKNGRRLEDLPDETKAYLKRAMGYIKNNPEQYSLEKINQEIAEVSNDNQEGTNGMFNYANPNAENFYDPRQRENILYNNDDYIAKKLAFNQANGIFDPVLNDQVARLNGVDNGVLANNSVNSQIVNGKNANFVNAETGQNVGDGVLATNNNVVMNGDNDMQYKAGLNNNTDNSLISAQASTLNNDINKGVLNSNFLSQPAATEKRRDRQDLSKGVRYPEDIDLNEMLIRRGGAGLANSQLGGNRQIADATAMYGNIMDYNRGQALAKYKVDMANAKKTAKQARADQDYLGNIEQSLGDMDKALMGIKDGGVTGLFDGTVKAWWDSLRGNPEAKTRLLLQKLKVDDTLLRIAQTKGAISNKEMDLFMSPAPSVGLDQENIWAEWINERKVALQRIKARLTGNMQVVNNQQASQSQIFNGIQVRKLTP